jgi:hypothetical protein
MAVLASITDVVLWVGLVLFIIVLVLVALALLVTVGLTRPKGSWQRTFATRLMTRLGR